MGDIKLFQIGSPGVKEIQGHSIVLERSLQTLIEKNLETLLGVRFLAWQAWGRPSIIDP